MTTISWLCSIHVGDEPIDLTLFDYVAMDWRNDPKQQNYVMAESKELVSLLYKWKCLYYIIVCPKFTWHGGGGHANFYCIVQASRFVFLI